MKDFFSPGSLVTVAGGILTVVGAIAYSTGSANLSLPTIFYGIPILLGGLALKSSELPPAIRITSANLLRRQREAAAPELSTLIGDVTRWRYGQKAHLESSLEALKLWDDDNPPRLEEIEELDTKDGYGLRLRFQLGSVSLERWVERKVRLGRFFAKGLRAEIKDLGGDQLDLLLLPGQTNQVHE
ncbi:DUF2854 domain-containing protein [Synechococcus sp. M16CYN]|uniref:DUF2854 domain-containing protein n=1 Tax=Synechococcus sp. M16CYN TaxID=3103139 RepID=UPI003255D0A5